MSFPSMTATWRNDTYPAIDPTRPELSMEGKNVIITGGSSGIGRETVMAFAAAGAASIAVLARRIEMLEETKAFVAKEYPDVKIDLYGADVTNKIQVSAAASKIGNWDVLVMNAGYMTPPKPMLDANLDDWWKVWEVNIKGTIIVAQAFLPTRNKGAVVVGTSSAAAVMGLEVQANASSYAGSKLALVKLFEIMGAEYPDVHFVTFHPGVVETAMFTTSEMEGKGFPMDDVKLPAYFTVWLASPEAAFLRGKFVWANWDVDGLKGKKQSIMETPILTSGIVGWPFQP